MKELGNLIYKCLRHNYAYNLAAMVSSFLVEKAFLGQDSRGVSSPLVA